MAQMAQIFKAWRRLRMWHRSIKAKEFICENLRKSADKVLKDWRHSDFPQMTQMAQIFKAWRRLRMWHRSIKAKEFICDNLRKTADKVFSYISAPARVAVRAALRYNKGSQVRSGNYD